MSSHSASTKTRILVTGMSGTGKSTLIAELASRGYRAVDVDDPILALTYPRRGGELGWNVQAIRALLHMETASPLFLAGCSEEQAELYDEFDLIVLLSAPEDVLRTRLASREGNNYGKSPDQLAAVLHYVETIEPLLRRRADLEIVTTMEVERVADIILARLSEPRIVLRPWTNDDLWLLHATLGDPAMMQHLGGIESPEQIEQRHLRYANGGEMFTVWRDDVIVGKAGFWEKTWRGAIVYEADWMILPKYAGRGLATQAARAVISLARNEQKHRFMHAFPNVENSASNAVCRNAGFTNLGECMFEYPKGSWMRCNDWSIDLAL